MELIPNWRTGSAKWQFWGLWHPPLLPTSALPLNLTCLGPLPPNLPFLNSPPRCHSWFPELTCPTLGLFTPPQPPPTRPNPAPFSSDVQHGLKFHRITSEGKRTHRTPPDPHHYHLREGKEPEGPGWALWGGGLVWVGGGSIQLLVLGNIPMAQPAHLEATV